MKLLVAIDLHAAPEDVVDGAVQWAQRLGATIDLLHVDETPVIAGYVHDPVIRRIASEEHDRLVAAHQASMDALLVRVPEAHRGQARLVRGHPATVVVDEAAAYDGVMVATHGRTGAARLWLGSVAERIVRTCPVPILVWPLPHDAT